MDHVVEHLDIKTRLAALLEKAKIREAEDGAAHRARMATLPVGTCERCYGTMRVTRHGYGEACPVCDPPILHADGVPVEFHTSRFANFSEDDSNRAALTKAQAWLAGDLDLYLTGGVGAGKTRLACAIANASHEARKWPLFVRVPMILHQLQPGRPVEEIAALEDRLFSRPILILDDIGAERDMATDYTRRTLLMMYEERHDRGLRTVFTSNKTIQQLADMQDDDRLASRIAGWADVVRLTTPDQRMARHGR